MRKVLLSITVTFSLLFFFTLSASAHSVQSQLKSQKFHSYSQPSSVKPLASGGGCSSNKTNGTGDITASACISYAYPYLQPDGYASFQPLSGHGGVSSCKFRLEVYEGTSYLERIDYNCAVAAATGQHGAHFGPLSIFATGGGVSYYSLVKVTVQYSDGYTTLITSYASPAVTL